MAVAAATLASLSTSVVAAVIFVVASASLCAAVSGITTQAIAKNDIGPRRVVEERLLRRPGLH